MNHHNKNSFLSQAHPYDRALDLPPLLKLWPWEFEDQSTIGREKIIVALHRALRAERRRRANNHWSYDMNRHHALLKAYKEERKELEAKHKLNLRSKRV